MARISKRLVLILELMPWSTAQISMRDSLSRMDRPEQLPTHNQATTATQHIPYGKRKATPQVLVDIFTFQFEKFENDVGGIKTLFK